MLVLTPSREQFLEAFPTHTQVSTYNDPVEINRPMKLRLCLICAIMLFSNMLPCLNQCIGSLGILINIHNSKMSDTM